MANGKETSQIPAASTSIRDYARMQTGEPLAIFKKTHKGKAVVRLIDPFTEQPTETILKGMSGERSTFVEVWTEREYMYFLRANKVHLDSGAVVEHKGEIDNQIVMSFNNLPDDEMETLIGSKFFTLKSAVEQMTTEAPLLRLIALGEGANKPEKTMQFLRERLSLIQSGDLEE